MRRALQLARRGLGRVAPNPPVGAVAVRGGRIVGEGWHRVCGGPHAEADLLLRTDPKACRGADLYVTLEPCGHHGKTPPCANAVAAAGFRRVFYATGDPNPKTQGVGLRTLERSGIETHVGMLEDQGRLLLAPYFQQTLQQVPLVTAKWAMTLDGRMASASGDSKWITDERARAATRRLRGEFDGILVGSGTALADDPMLTARSRGKSNPIRIVLDSQLRLPLDSQLVRTAGDIPLWLITAKRPQASRAHAARRRRLEAAGVVVHTVGSRARGDLQLRRILRLLAQQGLSNLLVEGGGQVHGSFFDQKLVDRVQVVIGPKVIGGAEAAGPVGGRGAKKMATAPELTGLDRKVVGDSWLLQGAVTAAGLGDWENAS